MTGEGGLAGAAAFGAQAGPRLRRVFGAYVALGLAYETGRKIYDQARSRREFVVTVPDGDDAYEAHLGDPDAAEAAVRALVGTSSSSIVVSA